MHLAVREPGSYLIYITELEHALRPWLVYGSAAGCPVGSVSAFSLEFISIPHVERGLTARGRHNGNYPETS